jgi:hypothetical protein
VNADRHQRWLDIVGAGHWSLTVSGWTLLAISAQFLWSGLAAEAGQYRRRVRGSRACRPWALRGR